jgi:Skp family chaperone for outer membrane proteins
MPSIAAVFTGKRGPAAAFTPEAGTSLMKHLSTPRWSKGLSLVCIACLSGGIALSYSSAIAQPAAQKVGPTALASIDLNKVLDNLTEAKLALERLKGEQTKRQTQLDEINTQISARTKRLEALPENKLTPERRQIMGELFELQAQGRVRKEVLERVGDLDAGGIALEIYEKINDAVKRYAMLQGYDIVVTDDQGLKLPGDKALTDKDVARYTRERQVLFASPRIDITDQIITMMNNEFNSRPAGAAPKPQAANPKGGKN